MWSGHLKLKTVHRKVQHSLGWMLEGWYGRWRPGLADNFYVWRYLDPHRCVQIGQSFPLLIRSLFNCWGNASNCSNFLQSRRRAAFGSHDGSGTGAKYLHLECRGEVPWIHRLLDRLSGPGREIHNLKSRIVSCSKPSYMSQRAFKISIALQFWANKHELALPSQ